MGISHLDNIPGFRRVCDILDCMERTGPESIDGHDRGVRDFERFVKLYKQFVPGIVKNWGFFSERSRKNEELEMLAWVFVGEKPSFFETTGSPSAVTEKILSKLNLKVARGFQGGWFVYSPESVQRVIDANLDIFHAFGATTSTDAMNRIARTPLDKESTVRGLLLGFPREAVEAYARHSGDAQWQSGIKGYRWTDFSLDSEQSESRRQYLAKLWGDKLESIFKKM